jgi:hypothetical protein
MDFTVIREFPPIELESAWRTFLTHADFPTHYTAPEFFLEKHLARRHLFAVLAIERSGNSWGADGTSRVASNRVRSRGQAAGVPGSVSIRITTTK